MHPGFLRVLSVFFFISAAAFSYAGELNTRYAVVVYDNDEQLYKFNKRMSLGHLSYLMRDRDCLLLKDEVGCKVDVAVEKVEEILEMFPGELKFKIILLPSSADVRELHRKKYGRDIDYIAFYSLREKTVFLSIKDINLGVFAHEITHAVIDSYFNNKPPAKIHEILGRYVESQISY
jgi:hypothetical protein